MSPDGAEIRTDLQVLKQALYSAIQDTLRRVPDALPVEIQQVAIIGR